MLAGTTGGGDGHGGSVDGRLSQRIRLEWKADRAVQLSSAVYVHWNGLLVRQRSVKYSIAINTSIGGPGPT